MHKTEKRKRKRKLDHILDEPFQVRDTEMEEVMTEIDEIIRSCFYQSRLKSIPPRLRPIKKKELTPKRGQTPKRDRLPQLVPLTKKILASKMKAKKKEALKLPMTVKKYFNKKKLDKSGKSPFEIVREFNRLQPTRQEQLDNFNRPPIIRPISLPSLTGFHIYTKEVRKLKKLQDSFDEKSFEEHGSNQVLYDIHSRLHSSSHKETPSESTPKKRLTSARKDESIKRELHLWQLSIRQRDETSQKIKDVIRQIKQL